jgi:glycogen(starch) synthase
MIASRMKEKLFVSSTVADDNKMPDLNNMVDDYLKLRLRRTLQSWKSSKLPPVTTHSLKNDEKDDILNFIRKANLINDANDRVKIVYHPEFISPTNPLFGMEYHQFVRGCHLGVFPSYYEPWGYTPLEAIASGIPAVTSDLAGFGNYVKTNIEDHDDKGIYIIDRRFKNFDESSRQLAELLFRFAKLDRRQRITMRNEAESTSTSFGWDILTIYYSQAYRKAMEAIGKA